MAEERKGQPIEKWDAVRGHPHSVSPMRDQTMDAEGRSIGERFIELRESTGMNRMEFSEYLGIPYRTMQDWERETRVMPGYVFALIEYKVQNEFGPDPKALGSQMRGIEDMVEQNDNSFDGIINNLPNYRIPAETEATSQHARESVLKKLRDCVKILEEEKGRRPRPVCEMERC